MTAKTEVISLRVEPETRVLLQKRADREGMSLSAFVETLAENGVGPSTQFEMWADDVEKMLDLLADIGATEELLELGPRSLERNVVQIGGDLDELLSAIVEAGGLGEDDEDEDEDGDDE